MSMSHEEMKAQIVAETQARIEQLVDEIGQMEEVTLSDIERLVSATTQEVQAELTERLIERQANETREEDRNCPRCGARMRNKGPKERHLVTVTGTVKLKREYYYCETCRAGVFPPGQALGPQRDRL